jgi:acyl-CoA thioester hydrolase
VFINTQTQQLATIPPEVIQSFAPDGDVKDGTRREKFPEPPAPPEEVFKLRKRIEWRDIDTEGHANNAAYFSLIEDTSTQVGRHYGWGMPRMVEMGMVMVMRRLRVMYVQPALMDDEVEISAYLSDYRRISVTRHYIIRRVSDDALLARARALWVCFDLNKQRPARIPDAMAHDFAPNIVMNE